MTHRVVHGTVDDLELVAALFQAMVRHHATVSDVPTRDPGAAWQIRRRQYEGWLADGSGTLLLAVAGDAPPDGYAMVTIGGGGATWDVGERLGELESLAVAESARGAGVGSLLIAAAREHLRAHGVPTWSVNVVAGNDRAAALYEREGFRPFSQQLLGPV